jgi:hypothetical protein
MQFMLRAGWAWQTESGIDLTQLRCLQTTRQLRLGWRNIAISVRGIDLHEAEDESRLELPLCEKYTLD